MGKKNLKIKKVNIFPFFFYLIKNLKTFFYFLLFD
jgi:hypothetical protein